MAFSAAVTEQIVSGGSTVGQTNDYSGDGRISIDIAVADSTTDQEVVFVLDVSQIQTIYVTASTAMTIETNAVDATGGNTIVLVADVPLIWSLGGYYTNLFTQDIVTNIFVTNASGSNGTLKIECIYDSTL